VTTPATRSIVHIVMWRLNGSTPAERARQGESIVRAFEEAKSRVPGLLRLEAGANVVESPDAWDVAVCMVFASREDLAAYQNHPDHLAIKRLMGPMRSARCQADFELTI
jgi:hypothetical protein